MKPINPEVTSYLAEQDFKAVERIAKSLVEAGQNIEVRAKARQLSVQHIHYAESGSVPGLDLVLSRSGMAIAVPGIFGANASTEPCVG